MFDRRCLTVVLAMAAMVAVSGGRMDAQARPVVMPNADSLLSRVRALDSATAVRSQLVDSMRRAIVRRTPPVAIGRGSLSVRTVAALERRVRVAVDSAARLVERDGGPQLALRVGSHVPTLVTDSARAIFGMRRVITLSPDTARRSTAIARRPMPAAATAGQIADALIGMIEQVALEGTDSTLRAWLMVGRVPLRPATTSDLGDVYLELATTPSAGLRRCRSGDAAACLDVLGIDSLPGMRLSRWYAPEDYRALLRLVTPPREDSAAVAAWVRCREHRDQPACVSVAAALQNDLIPMPLSANARAIVLREVLEAGGPGAYGRLVTASGPIRSRLERASGESIEATVTRWGERIGRARPDQMRLQPGLVIASLGWSGLLVGCTLIRRRPWG